MANSKKDGQWGEATRLDPVLSLRLAAEHEENIDIGNDTTKTRVDPNGLAGYVDQPPPPGLEEFTEPAAPLTLDDEVLGADSLEIGLNAADLGLLDDPEQQRTSLKLKAVSLDEARRAREGTDDDDDEGTDTSERTRLGSFAPTKPPRKAKAPAPPPRPQGLRLKRTNHDPAPLLQKAAAAKSAIPASAAPDAKGIPLSEQTKLRKMREQGAAKAQQATPSPADDGASRRPNEQRFPEANAPVYAKTSIAQVKAQDPNLKEGSRLGNYEVIRRIGQGGMGVVYEGKHLLLPRRVAIKFLKTDQSQDEEQIRRFLGEAVASSQIGHRGVVDIYDYGHDHNNTAYLIMEYLEGQSLQAILKRGGTLPMPTIIRVVREIAEVLEAAHRCGIVHRDLKPDNIFLARDENGHDYIKILDFGVAKFVNAQAMSGKTKVGSILGTPWYMPPEQCKGSLSVDFRSDIYALGCVFYQMVCGKVPFAGKLRDVLIAQIHNDPQPPHTLNPAIPPVLEQLILRMMAKEPVDRPAAMAEVASTLALFAEPAPDRHVSQRGPVAPAQPVHAAAQPPTAAAPLPNPVRHHGPATGGSQWLAPIAVAIVAALVALSIFLALQGD